MREANCKVSVDVREIEGYTASPAIMNRWLSNLDGDGATFVSRRSKSKLRIGAETILLKNLAPERIAEHSSDDRPLCSSKNHEQPA